VQERLTSVKEIELPNLSGAFVGYPTVEVEVHIPALLFGELPVAAETTFQVAVTGHLYPQASRVV
jgi:hypothetical protein